MKKIITALCLFLMSFNAYSQSVFTYSREKDIFLGVAALGVFASPFFVNNVPATMPVGLDKKDVNMLDRSLMFSYNRPLDKISDYGVYALLVLPAISLAGNMKDINAWLTYGIMYTEALFLTFGTKDLLKNAIIRYRPYMYSGGIPDGLADDYYNSFPSGSTALAFLSAGFLSATFSAEYPDSKWRIPIIAGAYTAAAGVAVCRIASGSHFLTDVFAGAVIGSLFGWAIPALHKRQNNKNSISINFTGNGFIAALKY
ncbi:MAG TPA: phosphatidic acid phosphatase [Treponema sp.]|nr:phosphatidic acid phosphatase [Treponema sp.]